MTRAGRRKVANPVTRSGAGSGSIATGTCYRRGIGRATVVGLEILIAAEIICVAANDPNFRSVGVLAIIVLVRTFLSLSLQLEIDGRRPWQHPTPAGAPSAPPLRPRVARRTGGVPAET